MKNLIVEEISVSLPTQYGTFRLVGYVIAGKEEAVLALVYGDITGTDPVLLRVHSQCITGDVFHSRRCDCQWQLENAIQMIAARGRGVIVYQMQEGRGIGIIEKLKAYRLQEQDGLDTVEANVHLGHAPDLRHYDECAAVLKSLGIHQVQLLTNNPEKYNSLQSFGIEVVERIPLSMPPSPITRRYLSTKHEKFGHFLENAISGEGEGAHDSSTLTAALGSFKSSTEKRNTSKIDIARVQPLSERDFASQILSRCQPIVPGSEIWPIALRLFGNYQWESEMMQQIAAPKELLLVGKPAIAAREIYLRLPRRLGAWIEPFCGVGTTAMSVFLEMRARGCESYCHFVLNDINPDYVHMAEHNLRVLGAHSDQISTYSSDAVEFLSHARTLGRQDGWYPQPGVPSLVHIDPPWTVNWTEVNSSDSSSKNLWNLDNAFLLPPNTVEQLINFASEWTSFICISAPSKLSSKEILQLAHPLERSIDILPEEEDTEGFVCMPYIMRLWGGEFVREEPRSFRESSRKVPQNW